jgi:hypothetical protein
VPAGINPIALNKGDLSSEIAVRISDVVLGRHEDWWCILSNSPRLPSMTDPSDNESDEVQNHIPRKSTQEDQILRATS